MVWGEGVRPRALPPPSHWAFPSSPAGGYFSNVVLLAMTNGQKPALPPHCLYQQVWPRHLRLGGVVSHWLRRMCGTQHSAK